MSEVNYEEIFDNNKELSEDEVIMELYNSGEGDISIKEATGMYQKFAKAAGLIVTPAQKKVQWEDSVQDENVDISTEEGVARAKEIGKSLDIGASTVTKYLKTLAEESGIELPTVTRTAGPRADSMASKLNEWFIEKGGDVTNDDIRTQAKELGMSDRSVTYYISVYRIVKDVVAALN